MRDPKRIASNKFVEESQKYQFSITLNTIVIKTFIKVKHFYNTHTCVCEKNLKHCLLRL